MTDDIVDRLRKFHAEIVASDGGESPQMAMMREAADNIEFLRKQSRGHFEAMTAVLRDGMKPILPDAEPKKPN